MEYFGRPLEDWAGYSHDEKIAYIAAIRAKSAVIKKQNAAMRKK